MQHKTFARYAIGNPRRVWRQDQFLLSVCNPGPYGLDVKGEWIAQKTRRAVKTAVDAGFDLIGSLWASPETSMEMLRTTEALGAKLTYQNLKRMGGMGTDRIHNDGDDLTGILEDLAPWKSLAAIWMWDEPSLPEHLERTRKLTDLCEKLRPDILPMNVALPSYGRDFRWDNGEYPAYIDRFMDVIDPAQMMFDYYPIGLREHNDTIQLDGSLMWCDMETVRRSAQKHEIPFWFVYQGTKFPFYKHTERFTFPMVRLMANAAILHGAKALDYYVEFEGTVDPETGGRGYYFEEQKQLNRELHNLGNTLMALTCLRVIHDETLLADSPYMEGLRTPLSESELIEGGVRKRVSISEHEDAYGHKYLMVLNRDYDRDTFADLKLKNLSNVYRISREDGEERCVHVGVKEMQIALAPGDLALYRIQPAEEEPYTIEYYLEKNIKE